MENKVKSIMGKILNEDISKLDINDVTPNNLESWDSLSHLSFVTALEEEFNLEFSIDEILVMQKGLKYVMDVLQKNGIN